MDDRLDSLNLWLQASYGDDRFNLQPLAGDASFRRYFRIERKGVAALAVDMPPDKENLVAFIALSQRLHQAGVLVPTIHDCDAEQGYLIIDDFGDTLLNDALDDQTAKVLYQRAIDRLVEIQAVSIEGLPDYDYAMLSDEMQLFSDWYCTQHKEVSKTDARIAQLAGIYQHLATQITEHPRTFVHRDYHSRNLICCKQDQQQDLAVIDYQDAVYGSVAYDLVSLLKDCYVKWPRSQQLRWLHYYVSHANLDLEEEQFIDWFDTIGVQRHLKAAGIFARLAHRDGKNQYLDDIPRTLSYITELETSDAKIHELQEIIGQLI